jgi:hypothetical protein
VIFIPSYSNPKKAEGVTIAGWPGFQTKNSLEAHLVNRRAHQLRLALALLPVLFVLISEPLDSVVLFFQLLFARFDCQHILWRARTWKVRPKGKSSVFGKSSPRADGGTFSWTLCSAFLVYASSFSLSDASLLFSDSRFFRPSFNLFTWEGGGGARETSVLVATKLKNKVGR